MLVDADVLVPKCGIQADEGSEQVDAFLGMQIDNLHTILTEPVDATGEIDGFAHDDGGNGELADQAAAIPARGESGDHDFVAVGALAAGAAEGIGFGVDGGVVVLDAAVVALGEEISLAVEEGGADGNAALGEAEAGFGESDGEH